MLPMKHPTRSRVEPPDSDRLADELKVEVLSRRRGEPSRDSRWRWLGLMRGSVTIHRDIVAPASEPSDWEAVRPDSPVRPDAAAGEF